jgi:hypothetical protein
MLTYGCALFPAYAWQPNSAEVSGQPSVRVDCEEYWEEGGIRGGGGRGGHAPVGGTFGRLATVRRRRSRLQPPSCIDRDNPPPSCAPDPYCDVSPFHPTGGIMIGGDNNIGISTRGGPMALGKGGNAGGGLGQEAVQEEIYSEEDIGYEYHDDFEEVEEGEKGS